MNARLDYTDEQDSAYALGKILGHPDGSRPVCSWFGGHGFAVRGDLEPIRLLFGVEGIVLTRAVSRDPLRLTGRQLILFKDPDRVATLDGWQNPYTGKTVPVRHQSRVLGELRPSALMPWFITGQKAVCIVEDHRGERDSSSMQLVIPLEELEDRRRASAAFVGTWQTTDAWWPWMAMDERPGYLFMRMFMRKFVSFEALPRPLRRDVEQRFPTDMPG